MRHPREGVLLAGAGLLVLLVASIAGAEPVNTVATTQAVNLEEGQTAGVSIREPATPPGSVVPAPLIPTPQNMAPSIPKDANINVEIGNPSVVSLADRPTGFKPGEWGEPNIFLRGLKEGYSTVTVNWVKGDQKGSVQLRVYVRKKAAPKTPAQSNPIKDND